MELLIGAGALVTGTALAWGTARMVLGWVLALLRREEA